MSIQQNETITASDINTALNGKSNTGHTHDDRYYTKTEINTADFMPKSGGTFTGNVSMGSYILTVPTPALP